MSTLYTTTTAGVVALLCSLAASPSPQREPSGLAGVWKVSLHEQDGTELDFRMTFETSSRQPVTWEAYSRPGAAREIVGGGKAFFGSLFGKLPPHGALVHIAGESLEPVEPNGPAIHLRGTLESPFLGSRKFDGRVSDGVLRADLTRTTGASAGRIEAVRHESPEPLRDYRALAGPLERAFKAKIFNPALLQKPDFERFFKEFASYLERARDDLDVVGAFQALVPSLRLSHLGLIRNPTLASRSTKEIIEGDPGVNPEQFVRLMFPVPEVAHLRVTRWDRVAPAIDRAFSQLDATRTQVLMLDIRGNPGGDHSSISALAHLIREPVTVGTFVGRRWYDSHATAPSASELQGLPALTSEATAFDLLDLLQTRGAVIGRAVPRAPYFPGKVYVFVDGNTASASEPLVYELKAARRGRIVGERTAGAMLMALPEPLQDGWVVTIPLADFIVPDGTRLEGRGVSPDVPASPGEVFLKVADEIASALPFSAEALRAGSLESLKRTRDAERAYRQAIRVVDRQEPRPSAAARAVVHRRLAGLLTTRGDRPAALREYAEVLKLVPDDAEALTATRGR